MNDPLPTPGWYADPNDAHQTRWWDGAAWSNGVRPIEPPGLGNRRPELDRTVAEMRAESPQPWGWGPVAVPLVTMVALIVVGSILATQVDPASRAAKIVFAVVITFATEAALALSVWLSARPIADRHGGWGRTFGLRPPRWQDLGYAALGVLATFALRGGVVGIANAASHGRAGEQAQNVHIDRVTTAGVILLVVVVVIVAPITEEILFRGVLLRTFMRRVSFWPAALLSTGIFAVLHVYEVDSVLGAVTLAAAVACLGVTNCYLNRVTDRLVPGMLVHAAFNLLGVIVLIAQAS